MNTGNVDNDNKTNDNNRVRAVVPLPSSATSEAVYDIPFHTVVRAWIDCEQNKRSSNSCTKFRWHAARNLAELWEEICHGWYRPKASMVFMTTYPVLREIWASAFRDRIVHHWEYLRYQPVLEKFMVETGDRSMNCRKGYGPLRAVKTFRQTMCEFTENYTRNDCYIVGGDFANYFMSIDKHLLWALLKQLLTDNYHSSDINELLYLMRVTIFHRCQDNYFRRSPATMWNKLPARKSLFHMDGLPIGNLPSQNLANMLGAVATAFAVHRLKLDSFIIFVDDWRCLVRSRDDGKRIINIFREFLSEKLHITLHPNKIYLQHYTKGTKLVGAMLKPHRVYISNRTRGRFMSKIMRYDKCYTTDAEMIGVLTEIRATVNSYLGMMKHYNSYNVRRKICKYYIMPKWGKYIYFVNGFSKCVIRKQYDRLNIVKKRLKNHNFAAKFLRPIRDDALRATFCGRGVSGPRRVAP